HSTLVGPVATTIAHELAHNLGLVHDDPVCGCPDNRCIMANISGGITNPTKWSVCSKNQFAEVLEQGMDYCLHNLPDKLVDGPVCGNGFREEGEQCDCGLPEDCDNPCCNPHSCTLLNNATCSMGKCCDLQTCRLKPSATVCRASTSDCDVAEYCSGTSEYCPDDVHVHDGMPCLTARLKNPSYCYHGKCTSHDEQCQLLWGRTGLKSHDACYEKNVLGTQEGNCGLNWDNFKNYLKCEKKNIQCGMLHCEHKHEKLMLMKESMAFDQSDSYITLQGVRKECKGVVLDVGYKANGPGMVPDGAKCAEDMICINMKCQPLHILTPFKCPDCHGHGICNSLFQCHCDPGFSPPFCDTIGYGGSNHSNPSVSRQG
ncbi:hypothetical protein HELRODRAFT_120989, partial [Helobdella robusta]|uniref:Disintegrin domain-containing protein n=1 Tax=Helobdella robusta TaxID=6412 RepID=T1EGQ8_HELRO